MVFYPITSCLQLTGSWEVMIIKTFLCLSSTILINAEWFWL